jgi:hypothetical protein
MDKLNSTKDFVIDNQALLIENPDSKYGDDIIQPGIYKMIELITGQPSTLLSRSCCE